MTNNPFSDSQRGTAKMLQGGILGVLTSEIPKGPNDKRIMLKITDVEQPVDEHGNYLDYMLVKMFSGLVIRVTVEVDDRSFGEHDAVLSITGKCPTQGKCERCA